MFAPIFITGIPRSGVSIYAQAIEYSKDIWIGDVYRQGQSEPGFMENKDLCRHVIQPFLTRHGLREDAFLPGSVEGVLTKGHFLHTMFRQGYAWGRWMYADHRLLPIWKPMSIAFPEVIWLIIERDKTALLDSCQNTAYLARKMTDNIMHYLNADNTRQAWEIWFSKYDAIVKDLQRSQATTFTITDKMSLEEVKEVFDKMSIHFTDEMKQFLKRVRR